MARARKPSPQHSLPSLLQQCGEVLAGLEHRRTLLLEMHKLGERIDDAYDAFRKSPRTTQDQSLLDEAQAALQMQIERLRTEADMAIESLWDLHKAARGGLEAATIQDPTLMPILERLDRLPLPEAKQSIRHVLRLRTLFQEAMGIPEPTPETTGPTKPAQRQTGGLLSARQVADELGLSDKTVYRLAKDARIPYVRIQSSLRFRRADVEDWLASKSFRLSAKRSGRQPA